LAKETPVKKLAIVGALVLGVVALGSAMDAADWGSNFDAFKTTCAERGGVVNGKGYGATCSFKGGVATLPAGQPGWTVDVAEGTVATWRGRGKVVEAPSNGTIIVACHDDSGERMRPWNQYCVKQ
jgi:hypothetical protein